MIISQAIIFILFAITGLIIGLIFDFFRILRRTVKTNNFITCIEDILFWILTAVVILYSVFVFADGEIRIYMFISLLMGVGFYFLTISKYIIKINVFILTKLKKILQKPILFIKKCFFLEKNDKNNKIKKDFI